MHTQRRIRSLAFSVKCSVFRVQDRSPEGATEESPGRAQRALGKGPPSRRAPDGGAGSTRHEGQVRIKDLRAREHEWYGEPRRMDTPRLIDRLERFAQTLPAVVGDIHPPWDDLPAGSELAEAALSIQFSGLFPEDVTLQLLKTSMTLEMTARLEGTPGPEGQKAELLILGKKSARLDLSPLP